MVRNLGRLRVPYTISALNRLASTPPVAITGAAGLVGGYLLGGLSLLIGIAAAAPVAFALWRLLTPPRVECGPRDPLTGLPLGDTAARFIAQIVKRPRRRRQTVVMAIGLDDALRTAPRFGPHNWNLALAEVGDRITDVLRGGDQIVRLDGPAFGVVLRRLRRPGVDDVLGIAARLQKNIAAPITLQGVRLQVSASVGICFEDERPAGEPALFLAAAEAALEEAQVHGEHSIRIFNGRMRTRLQARRELAETVADALRSGQITCWFQPQICARSGRVTGLEALARWEHPVRGTLLPGDFLDPITARGLGPQLFEVVLARACAALRNWDRSGLHVPRVGVNVDAVTLRDPLLAERIEWDLDRFDLGPDRLAIEILEDVVAAADDKAVTHTLARLAELGCTIDLDDFGNGQESLGGLSRFGVHRIKIDRCFVAGAEADAEQRKMATAILEMAHTLEVETLAEGVATEGERAVFQSLGCGHLQGFGIGRPMPASAVPGWIMQHHARRGLPLSGSPAAAAMGVGETA